MMSKTAVQFAFILSLVFPGQAYCLGAHANGGAKIKIKKIMDTEENIIGQKIVYPSGVPRITSEVIEIPPKTAIPWHEHMVPMYAYILDGEIEVDYGDKGTRTINKGGAMIEAVNFPHKGVNNRNKTAKVLVVYVGAAGMVLEQAVNKK